MITTLQLFFLRSLIRQKEQILSSLCFGLSLALLLSLGTADAADSVKKEQFAVMLFVILLITTSWMIMKSSTSHEKEQTLTTLLLHPFKASHIIISYSSVVMALSLITHLILGWILAVLFGVAGGGGGLMSSLIICLMPYLLGLVPLGCLCSTLTIHSSHSGHNSSALLFPVIYFPLATPLTLVSIQTFKLLWHDSDSLVRLSSYPSFWLLCALGVFYAVLSINLFSQVVSS